jgi:hypothetical protein
MAEKEMVLQESEWSDEKLEAGLARLKEMHIKVCSTGSSSNLIPRLIGRPAVPSTET